MDKVFSARLDESVLGQMDQAVRRMRVTKKRFLEEAILHQVKETAAKYGLDGLEDSFGAWERSEKPSDIAARARRTFEKGLKRRHH